MALLAIKASVPPAALQMRPPAQSGLNAAGSVIHVAEGRVIFTEGDETDLFYKVVSGVVRLCKFLNDGRRQIEAFHTADDVFGLELGESHMLSAEAVSGCTLIAYRRRTLEALSEKDKSVSRQLLRYAMQNMAQAQEHSLLLGRRGAAEKVASFLIAWAHQAPGGKVINLPMTRQDIADYLGLTIETVSRTFSQFERDGLIALPNIREVHVTDVHALQDLAA